ncbi:MAG: sulfatase-like hydrolase/transferase [Verrucomicrobiaceae bacterium]|nr:sulfatase-like hydrolase/transferase [Verrucomicrobiaceae bacterium]
MPAILIFLALNFAFCGFSRAAPQPNIIVILADDMGYSDPGCFGGEMETPNIDRLAAEGVRLTHFQNGGMCVVSRATMLTSQWWPKMQKQFAQTPLLSENLHEAGYRTALIGKWHLRGDPMDRGFDHFFGFTGGGGDHFTGGADYRLDRAPFKDFGANYYSADAFTDRAVQFIQSAPKERPFFLYLSYQTPHNPLQASKSDIVKLRGRYAAGWQATREARFKRQKKMGIAPQDATLPDSPQNLPPWESLSPEQRDLEELRMCVFAAMIERMDRGIGRVMKALEAAGRADNTLILFMSDNGADPFSSADQALLKKNLLPGDPRSNFQLGTGWAYASVTPWRLYKISQHSGGVTTGAVVRWPAGGLGEGGRIAHSPVHMIDVLPTLVDVASAKPNTQAAGESFLPLLKGEAWRRQSPLFFQMADNRAIRTTEWTLAEVDGAGWELFRPGSDPFDNQNLAAQYPDVVTDLSLRWMLWWRRESGMPDYKPASTKTSNHYAPQGDRGSGKLYRPSAMPAHLKARYAAP